MKNTSSDFRSVFSLTLNKTCFKLCNLSLMEREMAHVNYKRDIHVSWVSDRPANCWMLLRNVSKHNVIAAKHTDIQDHCSTIFDQFNCGLNCQCVFIYFKDLIFLSCPSYKEYYLLLQIVKRAVHNRGS